MPNTREKLIELLIAADDYQEEVCHKGCRDCHYVYEVDCEYMVRADYLIANGVTIQNQSIDFDYEAEG